LSPFRNSLKRLRRLTQKELLGAQTRDLCLMFGRITSQVRPRRVRPVRWQIKDCQTTEPRTFDSGFSGKVKLSTLGFNVLGWLMDFRRMTITLLDNKFHAYSIAISEMLKRGCTSKRELKTNIGQWVHLRPIIPTIHHFLSRLRFLTQRAENRWQITINEQCKEDLHFLLFVLGKCNQGVRP